MAEENEEKYVRRRRADASRQAERQAAAEEASMRPGTEPERYNTGNLTHGNARFGEAQRMTASQSQAVPVSQYDPYTSVTGSQPWIPEGQNAADVPWVSGAQPVYGWQNQFRPGTQPAAPLYPQGQVPQAPKKTRGDRGGQPAPQPRQPGDGRQLKKMLIAILSGASVTLVILGVVLWFTVIKPQMEQERAEEERRAYIESQVTYYNDKYCPGVYVDSIDLGGKTQTEAHALVAEAAEVNNTWTARLMWEGELYATLTEADLGVIVDVNGALEQAWQQGHEGDTGQRWQAMEKLKETAYHGSTVSDSGTGGTLEASLKTLADSLYIAPADAEFLGFDPNRTDPLIFRKEVLGRALNIDAIREQALQMARDGVSGTIDLIPSDIEPPVTVASLKAERYTLRGFSSTPISPTKSTDDRNNNIRRAFELISGSVIQPGKSFDFNKIVGKRTLENGFFPAEEYVYGEHVPGIGGGVCQACTTIYQAAVRANMRIDKRTPHSLAVNYTPYGKDATVYWFEGRGGQKIDFIFTNTTDSPIYIKAAVQSDEKNKKNLVCNVWIYGETLGEGVTYDLDTEEVVIPAPEEPKMVGDRNAKYVMYEDEQYETQKAENGTEVHRWLVKYVNKKEVERTELETDIYPAKQQIIYFGTRKRPETR
ncbi:MAG: VanW family protein [Bacteroidales bacterium]|nr:VanW family protein [Bacteroidales bacterium]MBR4457384.1 VanW family protein [Clostridia bacterium]